MTREDREIELLSSVDILGPLTRGEVVDLHSRLPIIRLGRRQDLHNPNIVGEMIFLLLSGTVRLYRMLGEHEFTLDIHRSGTVFGETSLTGEPPQGTVPQSLDASTVALMRPQVFRELVLRHPRVGLRTIEVLITRNKRYAERMTEIAYKQVTARLASFLIWLAEEEGALDTELSISMRYTHQQLATMIGADRVGVTRAFRKLKEAGAVEQESSLLHIRDIRILREMAGE